MAIRVHICSLLVYKFLLLEIQKAMKIAISYESRNDPLGIEISEEMTLVDLSAYIEAETGLSQENQVIYHNNNKLERLESTLAELGVTDGDIIIVVSRSHDSANQAVANPTPTDRIEMYRQQILQDHRLREQLKEMDPQLYSKLSDGQEFKNGMLEKLQAHDASFNTQSEEIQRLQQNPDDPANQEKILEMIQQQRIEENLQLAYDISPESFVSVSMLYIKLRIKGHLAYALVDSGAQQTIIHPQLAEEFGILNLLDKRFATMTMGVGTAKSKGRIHSVPVSLGDTNLEVPCSFTVIETHVGILFGLDMLRRHKCSIDLSKDALVIGNREVKFLNEAEISKNVKALTTSSLESIKDSQKGADDDIVATRPITTSETASDTTNETEPAVQLLVALGFSREESIAALKATNGNMELAASLLFQ